MFIETFMQVFLNSLFGPTNTFLRLPTLIVFAALVLIIIKVNIEYKKSAYYQSTKIPLFFLRKDIGKFGEYLIYKKLKVFEKQGAKFLFNTYIPKEHAETTEIDVLMLCSKGIFVFESKNYSGWIFGNEKQKNWYQTLPTGKGRSRKESFYNPILQNHSHIRHLEQFLSKPVPMYSIIVFSERCTLKSVEIQDESVKVINRYDVFNTISKTLSNLPNDILNESEITEIYELLYPYTQINESIKEQHIGNIKQKTAAKIQVTANSALTSKETTDDVKICPKCGGQLILRTAKRGEQAGQHFYGCSNFPKCRYIKK